MNRSIWMLLATLAWAGCDVGSQVADGGNGSTGGGTGSSSGTNGGATGGQTASLVGTWDLTITPSGDQPSHSTLIIGENQLTITASDLYFTAQKTASTLNFSDADTSGGSSTAVVTATQSLGTFNAGMIPFDLGGTWTIQGGNQGQSPSIAVTGQISDSQINASFYGFDSSGAQTLTGTLTTTLLQGGSSLFGNLGGSWNSTFADVNSDGSDGGVTQCQLDFSGPNITTCASGGSFLQQITFSYDGNTVSGTAQSAEFSATRQ